MKVIYAVFILINLNCFCQEAAISSIVKNEEFLMQEFATVQNSSEIEINEISVTAKSIMFEDLKFLYIIDDINGFYINGTIFQLPDSSYVYFDIILGNFDISKKINFKCYIFDKKWEIEAIIFIQRMKPCLISTFNNMGDSKVINVGNLKIRRRKFFNMSLSEYNNFSTEGGKVMRIPIESINTLSLLLNLPYEGG